MIQHLQCLSLWLIIKFQSNLQQLLAKHFASLWDCWDTLTGQNKYTDLLHKNTLLGEVWLILAKQKNHNYLREMYGDIFMNTHTNRNAYFNHLASAGTVSLSTICPFVSSSIVTFPRVCVCVCVCICVFLWVVCVCVLSLVCTHACISSVCCGCQMSIWLGSIAKVRWRSILHSWIIEQHWAEPLPRLAEQSITQCHHLGTTNLTEDCASECKGWVKTHNVTCSFYINSAYLLCRSQAELDIKKRHFLVSFLTELAVRAALIFFFFFSSSVWGQRCSVPTERSCFHPWIWSIMDGTPTASQAGIAWKKTWKTGRNSASPGASRRRRGHAWPPISTNILQPLAGCDCSEARSNTQTHTRTHWQTPLESGWPTPLTTLLICGPKMWKPIEVIINDSSYPENVKCGLGA